MHIALSPLGLSPNNHKTVSKDEAKTLKESTTFKKAEVASNTVNKSEESEGKIQFAPDKTDSSHLQEQVKPVEAQPESKV